MIWNKTYYTCANNEQYLFDRCLSAIFFALKLLFKGFVYFPLLATGYLITTHILQKKDNALVWIGLTMLFAYILYSFIFFLKGILIALKSKGNLLWILLFAFCVGYTCVAPVWLFFDTIEKLMFHLSKEQGTLLTWIFSFAIGGYIYDRYQFLINIAPAFIAPFYQAGINLGLSIHNK
jgi:hypothetical protein